MSRMGIRGLLVITRGLFIVHECARTVTEDKFSTRSLDEGFDHLMAPNPVIMVSCKPPLRVTGMVILFNMVLVTGEDPSTGIL